ncbi:glycosyltransferase family 9 protein [Pseudomonadales bacterium]|nr:glycosyltransferase family 9 protein [Pseudomonadales bacterium]
MNEQSCSKAIVLYSDMGLGNWLLLGPILKELSNKTKYKIVLVEFSGKSPWVYINCLGLNVDVLRVDSRVRIRFLRYASLGIELRKRSKHYEKRVLFGRHTRSLKNIFLKIFFNCNLNLCYLLPDDKKKLIYSLLGVRTIKYPLEIHERDANKELARKLFSNLPNLSGSDNSFPIEKSNYGGLGNYCILQPISEKNQSWKRWPADNWIQLIEALIQKTGLTILIVGLESEKEEIDNLIANFAEGFLGRRCQNLAGQTSLPQLGAIVKDAQFSIGADSSIGHISATIGTRTVALIGPGGDGRSPGGSMTTVLSPSCKCNPRKTLLKKNLKLVRKCGGQCMRKISVEQVFDALRDKSVLGELR